MMDYGLWSQCSATFRPSKLDLLEDYYIDPKVLKHMDLPPILSIQTTSTSSPECQDTFSVHCVTDDGKATSKESEEGVECVALPYKMTTRIISSATSTTQSVSTLGDDRSTFTID